MSQTALAAAGHRPEEGDLSGHRNGGGSALIIGVDCATQPRNVGIAVARLCGHGLRLKSVTTGSGTDDQAGWIAEQIAGSDRVLLALDAPLGWPKPLGQELVDHRSGQPISAPANQMFRRHTDIEIKRRVGKQPLDVGANLIARTAVAALSLLEKIRQATHEPIDLAWEPGFSGRIAAIEVYPAATLMMLGLRSTKYKKRDEQRDARIEIAEGLSSQIEGLAEAPDVLDDDNLLDAVVCAIAGADFLKERAVAPDSIRLAKREGWIWVR